MTARRRPVSDPRELVARLSRAIDGKREVRLVYGSAMSLRLVWPHALGVSGGGNPTLLAWQTNQGTGRKNTGGWRQFNLAKVAGAEVSETTFDGPAPGYDPKAPGLAQVMKTL